jgi:hypothetical protein
VQECHTRDVCMRHVNSRVDNTLTCRLTNLRNPVETCLNIINQPAKGVAAACTSPIMLQQLSWLS